MVCRAVVTSLIAMLIPLAAQCENGIWQYEYETACQRIDLEVFQKAPNALVVDFAAIDVREGRLI